MGNCLFGSLGPGVAAAGGGARRLVRVVTTTGGVLEFQPPVTAGSLLDEFPGHRIVRSQELFWEPLPYNEGLIAGKTYYLFPFSGHATTAGSVSGSLGKSFGHIRSNSVPADSASMLTPYRMSVDSRETMRRSYTDALSRYSWSVGSGRVWKVKLIISPEQLQEILSSGDRTQELVDSMRVVAKCGAAGEGSTGTDISSSLYSSGGFSESDQWSLSRSRNAR
ncbi:hypothetical protein SAY87_021044 [Trapa incisa]|uniref:Uncharacterized protein n=1 Tax=Trapa incisa TaxID=236973 RepID=A0AAN7JRM7_9MYRT|nr:hypothetical protein SAY87_021044 [Trapa incisa]